MHKELDNLLTSFLLGRPVFVIEAGFGDIGEGLAKGRTWFCNNGNSQLYNIILDKYYDVKLCADKATTHVCMFYLSLVPRPHPFSKIYCGLGMRLVSSLQKERNTHYTS